MINVGFDVISKILAYNYSSATNNIEKTLERLNTGYKVNRASDSPTDYAISEKINTDILKYNSAITNAQSAITCTSIAKEGYADIQNILTELATITFNATDVTLTEAERNVLQAEADERLAEITKIKDDTVFNGTKILYGNNETRETEHLSTAELDALYGAGNYTVITSASEFSSVINSNKAGTFVLGNDIDFTGVTRPSISWFTGTFDGNGYTIKNLTMSSASGNFNGTGLFDSVTNGNLKNLTIENAHITANGCNYIGILAGRAMDGTKISNVRIIGGSVLASGSAGVGGLVGQAWNNTEPEITNCYSTASVTGYIFVGGLVGLLNGSISNSYATGSVSGNGTVGGLVGSVSSSNITNCYATGRVSSNDLVGGLVGSSQSVNIFSGNFFNTQTTNQTQGVGGTPVSGVTGLNTTGMETASNFINAGWDETIWNLTDGANPQFKKTTYLPVDKNFYFHIGPDTSSASMAKLNTEFDTSALVLDLSSSENALLALDTVNSHIQSLTLKTNEMDWEADRYTNMVTLAIENIQSLNQSVTDLIGIDEEAETKKLEEAQSLQSTTQYLISEIGTINKNIIYTLLGLNSN